MADYYLVMMLLWLLSSSLPTMFVFFIDIFIPPLQDTHHFIIKFLQFVDNVLFCFQRQEAAPVV